MIPPVMFFSVFRNLRSTPVIPATHPDFVINLRVPTTSPTILDMRAQSLEIRLTAQEKGFLQEKALSEGLTLSAWVRKELFPKEPKLISREVEQSSSPHPCYRCERFGLNCEECREKNNQALITSQVSTS
jgi:hypothetical protein